MNERLPWQWWLLEKKKARFNDGRGMTVPQMRDLDESFNASIVQLSPIFRRTNDRPSEAVVHRVVYGGVNDCSDA